MFVDRKASFKLPPTTIRDRLVSQEARRAKVSLNLWPQKRAQRFDSHRQLDLFADLSLGQSDDNDDDDGEDGDLTVDPTSFTPGSIAAYASIVEPYQPPNAISGTLKPFEATQNSVDSNISTKGKSKRRKKKKGKNKKPSKYADKCMYAELLEMSEDNPWSDVDGLPENLETAWVAVGPVPVGKRCLAVTHQSSGVAGVVPNTTLRSRLLGKTLIPRFPSNLPPLTVLDCILDANWRENGILHILDVVKWKGQDICDCEAPFRFWWRDTRLAELAQTTVIPTSYTKNRTDIYQFPYPTRLLPIPYHTDTTLQTLYRHIIPHTKSSRSLTIDVPNPPILPSQAPNVSATPPTGTQTQEDGMDVEPPMFTFGAAQGTHRITAIIVSDGLLLYVAEASYESGTSPLSSWVPIVAYDDDQAESNQDRSTTQAEASEAQQRRENGPLAVFERLVQRRLQKSGLVVDLNHGGVVEVEMA
ncbi:Snurportin-1 [Leucoagaricus sp. SymC.cos]|nr:Snurportin-1 [Leucoagaricus sp. SymC.cos]